MPGRLIKEIKDRLGFLTSVGIGYLTLARAAGTLSSGESQRIRLATQIGSALMGVMYILDEPTIGLHQRDNDRLINTLIHLRDLGNTLIVVEHDEDTIRASDYVIDMGPGAGEKGGSIIFEGTPEELIISETSLTGKYLSGRLSVHESKTRRDAGRGHLTIKGATCQQPQRHRRHPYPSACSPASPAFPAPASRASSSIHSIPISPRRFPAPVQCPTT